MTGSRSGSAHPRDTPAHDTPAQRTPAPCTPARSPQEPASQEPAPRAGETRADETRRGLVRRRVRRAFSDPATLRAWTVDVNDGVVATAGLLEGFARAGASSTNLVAAGIVATFAGGVALGGARWSEMAAERDARARLRAAATSTPATIPTTDPATAQGAGADARAGADAGTGAGADPDAGPDPDAGTGAGEDAPSASANDLDRDRSRLVQIYRDRGLSGDLPEQVADQLLAHDPLHARFEAEHGVAEPQSGTHATLQSLDAAIAFIIGSLLPLFISAFLPGRIDAWATVLVVVASLTVTSVVAARHNGAPVWRTVLRSVAVGVASLTVSSIAGSVLQP